MDLVETGSSGFQRFINYTSIILFTLISWSCERDIDILEDQITVYISPEDYRTVSDISTELLSCGAMSVAHDDGMMTVVYLTDEESPIETESSTSIFVRAARLNVNNSKGNVQFADIAKANKTLYGHNTGSIIPYEPNMVQTREGIYAMFREGGLRGKYISCKVNEDELGCCSYQTMTIDGYPMDSNHLKLVYERKGNCSLQSSPILVFTTRIIQSDNYYYSHIGGYGYNGMIIRSENGLDWESIMIPSTISGMNYILEGAVGMDAKTGNFFLCARGDMVALYQYDSHFNEIAEPRVLFGVTTSKPTFFNYNDNLYLIVNMDNDTSYSNGRRNTANIYKVNGQTGALTLVKSLKCKEGCAYHTVQVVNDEIWMIFQTDARHIALETQGRSNLALYKLKLN